MLEVEVKYQLSNRSTLIERLLQLGAVAGQPERHSDTYLRHPSRDFAETNEALRIRRINSVASVTYKGPKMPLGDQALKARKEIEWSLAPGDADGDQMTELLLALGFTVAAVVDKERLSFTWDRSDPRWAAFTVTVDQVQDVGLFAEVELLLDERSDEQAAEAGEQIKSLADELGLTTTVRESYLQLLLRLQQSS